jgi:hypothetical protein
MKNISEIDPLLYMSYFLTEENSDIVLKFNTSNGLVDIDTDDYDTFSTNNGTIIAFKQLHVGIQNYVYLSGLDRKYIQNQSYEIFEDIFNEPDKETLTIYSFMESVEIPSKEQYEKQDGTLPEDFVRCDYNKFGSKPFYTANNPIAVTRIINLLDVCGTGHILRIDTNNVTNPNPDSQSANTGGKTLTGVLKTIYEWSESYKPPFSNTESISKSAHNFLEEIQMPENVLNDIIDGQVDMRVSRYLKGETRQVYSFDEVPEIPDSLKLFIKTRYKYLNLISMKENHPNGFAIPDTAIAKEKEAISSKILEFCLMHGINFNNRQEIMDYFTQHPNKQLQKLISLYDKVD